MILNRKLLSITDPKEDFVKTEIEGIIDKSNVSFRSFSNDFYKIVQSSLIRIREFLGLRWIGIERHWVRTPEELNAFFGNLKVFNGLQHLRSINLKDHLSFLADNTESVTTYLNKYMASLDPLMTAAEGVITNTTTNSIRDENYNSVMFNGHDSVFSNTLNINTTEGCLTVPFIENAEIPYIPLTDKSVEISGKKLFIRDGSNAKIQTEKLFTSGYYFGKFIDLNPIFRNLPQPGNLQQDNEDTFYVESYEEGTLTAAINYTFLNPDQAIGTLNIEFGQCSDFPKISKILIQRNSNPTFEDITDSIFSKGLVVRGLQPQPDNKTIKPGNNQNYSSIKILINQTAVSAIKVVFECANSKEIEYQEYQVLDNEDRVIRVFNYFESLYIQDFIFNSELTIERTGINTADIEQALTTGRREPIKKSISKRFLAIRKLDFQTIQMSDRGEYISSFFGRGNEIQSVEINVNELIPEGLTSASIKYLLSTDGTNFIEIWPVNRQLPPAGLKNRLIFDSRDPARENVLASGRVKLKIVMDNSGSSLAPKVFGYLIRVKETFGI